MVLKYLLNPKNHTLEFCINSNMAIILTEDALEEMVSNGDTTPYLLLNKRVHTFPESVTMTGNNVGNVVPLHGIDGSTFTSDFLNTSVNNKEYIHFDESTRVGTGYFMLAVDNESDQKQQITGTDRYLTWSDDNDTSFDGKTIDFDYINDIFTIDIS